MGRLKWAGVFGTIFVLAGGAYAVFSWRSEIAPQQPPEPTEFDSETLSLGRSLSGLGACEVCHTAPNGEPMAGGLAIETPFGTVYSTNITPDIETGIGSWSFEAFRRSMHEGVSRDGTHLYPVFPYTHFSRVSDQDLRAIYAFLMSQEPVAASAHENNLEFPAQFRPLLAGWKFIFHDAEEYEHDPDQSDSWNRGAYLAEGLGHCSICHSPLNRFGAVIEEEIYNGGTAEGWHGSALNENSPAPVPWSELALVNYLLDGWDIDHGVAAGPMQPVVNHLRSLNEDDVFSMAEYFLSLQGQSEDDARDAAIAWAESRQFGNSGADRFEELSERAQAGAEVFEDVCASCHRAATDAVPLGLTSTINMPDPSNIIHIVFDGISAPDGAPDKSMRAFGNSVNDEEMAALLVFMREQFSERPAWTDIEASIRAVRNSR